MFERPVRAWIEHKVGSLFRLALSIFCVAAASGNARSQPIGHGLGQAVDLGGRNGANAGRDLDLKAGLIGEKFRVQATFHREQRAVCLSPQWSPYGPCYVESGFALSNGGKQDTAIFPDHRIAANTISPRERAAVLVAYCAGTRS